MIVIYMCLIGIINVILCGSVILSAIRSYRRCTLYRKDYIKVILCSISMLLFGVLIASAMVIEEEVF